jgi:hypothetical protein
MLCNDCSNSSKKHQKVSPVASGIVAAAASLRGEVRGGSHESFVYLISHLVRGGYERKRISNALIAAGSRELSQRQYTQAKKVGIAGSHSMQSISHARLSV